MAKALRSYRLKYPGRTQLLLFFLLSNSVTLFQVLVMPLSRWLLGQTSLLNMDFQFGSMGHNPGGTPYFIFDYPGGSLAAGGGGGLAYFLAVQITMGLAQVLNFFLHRRYTFQSNGKVGRAAAWFFLGYVLTTLGAAALQGIYKLPLYQLLVHSWGWGGTGEKVADGLVMIINSGVSFWVFFVILKLVFQQKKAGEPVESVETQ